MKKNKIFLLISIMVIGAIQVNAQVPETQALPDTSQMTYNQISLALDLFLFPTNDQSKQQQKVDEFECYIWAIDRTGIDPLNLPKVEVEVQTGPTGDAVKGAARGAAAGAAIGAIANNDAGEGAAIGAIVGGMRGRRSGKQAQAQQNQQAQAGAAAAEAETMNKFKKGFSACIEGKGYSVQ